MSSYLSSLLTSTTDRYNSLRRNIQLSSETDGDTPDDSHITRVLRAYYTEKSLPLPPWLPPDPKRPALPTPAPSNVSSVGAGYGGGGLYNTTTQQSGRGGLSDLWDAPAPSRGPAPGSLRGAGQQSRAPVQQNLAAPRPLPSQRQGSYQTSSRMDSTGGAMGGALQAQHTGGSNGSSAGGGGGGGGGTAQERLKARLWGQAGGGGRSASPVQQESYGSGRSPYQGGASPYQGGGGGQSPYQGGGGGGQSPYQQQGGGNPYQGGGGGQSPYQQQGGYQQQGNLYNQSRGGGGRWG